MNFLLKTKRKFSSGNLKMFRIFKFSRHELPKEGNSAFTLVEMLVYLAIMTVISVALVQSFVVVFRSNRASFADSNIRNSGYSAMEGILREIRSSQSVDVANSVLYPSSSGILQLIQINSDGSTNIVKFATTSASALGFSEGYPALVYSGPLTLNGTKVLNLIFNSIDTGNSKAVRVQLNLGATVNGVTRSEWFYGTAILRGSY